MQKISNSNISRLFKEYHYVLIINYAYSSEMTSVRPTNSEHYGASIGDGFKLKTTHYTLLKEYS